jgi:hypothetical protein
LASMLYMLNRVLSGARVRGYICEGTGQDLPIVGSHGDVIGLGDDQISRPDICSTDDLQSYCQLSFMWF